MLLQGVVGVLLLLLLLLWGLRLGSVLVVLSLLTLLPHLQS